jgi:hypothetical protein
MLKTWSRRRQFWPSWELEPTRMVRKCLEDHFPTKKNEQLWTTALFGALQLWLFRFRVFLVFLKTRQGSRVPQRRHPRPLHVRPDGPDERPKLATGSNFQLWTSRAPGVFWMLSLERRLGSFLAIGKTWHFMERKMKLRNYLKIIYRWFTQ